MSAYPVELLTDFQRFYNLKADKIIDRDPVRAEMLIRGLFQNPESLYRAKAMDSQQVPKGISTRVLDWLGWGATSQLLFMIYNEMLAARLGQKAQAQQLKAPGSRRVVTGVDVLKMPGGEREVY